MSLGDAVDGSADTVVGDVVDVVVTSWTRLGGMWCGLGFSIVILWRSDRCWGIWERTDEHLLSVSCRVSFQTLMGILTDSLGWLLYVVFIVVFKNSGDVCRPHHIECSRQISLTGRTQIREHICISDLQHIISRKLQPY